MDIPSEKTSEIKPTEIGDANGTIDDSLQGRQVVPDCGDMQVRLQLVTNMIVISCQKL